MKVTRRTQKTKPRILGRTSVPVGSTIQFRDDRKTSWFGPVYTISRLDRNLWGVQIQEDNT